MFQWHGFYTLINKIIDIMPIHLGQCFITWDDLRSELGDWAISAQFDFKAHKAERFMFANVDVTGD